MPNNTVQMGIIWTVSLVLHWYLMKRNSQSIMVSEAMGCSVVTRFPSNTRALEYVLLVKELLKVLK